MPRAAAAKDRLAFLDVARGLAALLVFVEHGLEICQPAYGAWTHEHVSLGKIGVLLFLMVSGFIIPVSLEQGRSNARFWLRRCFRLFPVYWVSILLAYVSGCCGRSVTEVQGWDWLLNLTMLHGFFNRPHVWGVFWTLQLEIVIYASCSLLFSVRLLKRAGWIAGLALAGYAAVALAGAILDNKPCGVGGKRFLYFAPLVGLVAQRFCAGQMGFGRLAALVLGHGLMVWAVWGFNNVYYPAASWEPALREAAWTWGLSYALFFLLLAARHRPMPAAACRVGQISYSVYLFHLAVLILVLPSTWPAWALLPSALVLTLLLSETTYRLVEAPGIALGRAIERRWLRAVPLPPAEALPASPAGVRLAA
jgi:peptidoglycan/LPS O-acetylase OafA/YrhL